MGVPGHTFHCVGGHRDTVFGTVFPAKGPSFSAEGSGRCGEQGSRLSAGVGAVTEELEEGMERSLVQGFVRPVQEAWGESHDDCRQVNLQKSGSNLSSGHE